jgi:ferric-dicitrate binding protein FerR (iron transport regulator)
MRGKRWDLNCDSAVRWLLRFVDGDVSTLSPDERAEWVRWSSEPGNLERFQRAERMWRSLDLVLPSLSG